MDHIVRAHILIEGRVQGVGYRAFVHRIAISEGLSGWVQNLVDGRVEIEVQGPREKIEPLLATFKKGPPLARVDQLHVNWLNLKEDSDDFQVVVPW